MMDDFHQNTRALKDLQAGVAGQSKVKENIMNGLENLPQALIDRLRGDTAASEW